MITTAASRERGFYWIRLKGDDADHPERWIVAEWDGDAFLIARAYGPVEEDRIATIDDSRMLSPHERLIPAPMRAPAPARMHPGIKDALSRLETTMAGRVMA